MTQNDLVLIAQQAGWATTSIFYVLPLTKLSLRAGKTFHTQKKNHNLSLLYFLTRGTLQQALHVSTNPFSNWAHFKTTTIKFYSDVVWSYQHRRQGATQNIHSNSASFWIVHKHFLHNSTHNREMVHLFSFIVHTMEKQVYIYFYKVQLTRR